MAQLDSKVQQSREFPKVSLAGLFLFGAYARDAIRRYWSGGISFRAFIKDFGAERSHRVLVKMADRLEYQSQKLLMNREYKDAQGVSHLARTFEEAERVRSKRNGTMTTYGEAWCELIEHISDLYHLTVGSENAEELLATIKAQRKHLKEETKHISVVRRPENFDTL